MMYQQVPMSPWLKTKIQIEWRVINELINEDICSDLLRVPAFEWDSKATTEANSFLIEFDKCDNALMCINSSKIVDTSSSDRSWGNYTNTKYNDNTISWLSNE